MAGIIEECDVDTALGGFGASGQSMCGILKTLTICGQTIMPAVACMVPTADNQVAAVLRDVFWEGNLTGPMRLIFLVNSKGAAAIEALLKSKDMPKDLSASFKMGLYKRDPDPDEKGAVLESISLTQVKAKVVVQNKKLALSPPKEHPLEGDHKLYEFTATFGPDPTPGGKTVFQWCTGGTSKGTMPWGGAG
jgi:hypothetical protein